MTSTPAARFDRKRAASIGRSPAMLNSAGAAQPPPAPRWVRLLAAAIRLMPGGRNRLISRLPRHGSPFLASMPTANGGSLSFECDLRDMIARAVCFTAQYEPQETALVRGLLRPGMTFVDAGANWGYYTLLAAALVGGSGRVISLEPHPRLFALLEGNIARNGLGQVTALQIAAAADSGTLTLAGFDEGGENWGMSRLVDDCATDTRAFQVAAQPIDKILEEQRVDHADLLKMDIEGAEDFALAGMAAGFASHRYLRLLLELHPWILAERDRTPLQACAPLLDNGYRALRIDHSPQATRRAVYSSSLQPRSFLSPMDFSRALDSFPHLLWLAPGIEA